MLPFRRIAPVTLTLMNQRPPPSGVRSSWQQWRELRLGGRIAPPVSQHIFGHIGQRVEAEPHVRHQADHHEGERVGRGSIGGIDRTASSAGSGARAGFPPKGQVLQRYYGWYANRTRVIPPGPSTPSVRLTSGRPVRYMCPLAFSSLEVEAL